MTHIPNRGLLYVNKLSLHSIKKQHPIVDKSTKIY